MLPSYTTWGRFGAVQYVGSASGRVLTDDHTIAFRPFVRGQGNAEVLLHTMQQNLYAAYDSIWRMTARHPAMGRWFDIEQRGALQQRVAAWWIEDLLVGLDTAPDYWIRNYRTLFTRCEAGWDRLNRIRANTHIPLVLRMRSREPFDPALIPILAALWRALGLIDRTPTVWTGHRLFLNTSQFPGRTLRERAAAIKELPAAFRARLALCNDDLPAHDFARLCTALHIPGALDVGQARDGAGARVKQTSALFQQIRTEWEFDVHTTIRTAPNFCVFLREPADATATVDKYLHHFLRNDTNARNTAPHVVLVPALF